MVMRLINLTTLVIEVHDRTIPSYAILSHTWGTEETDLRGFSNLIKSKTLPLKLGGFIDQAKNDGHNYAWVDTCCIDQANPTELSEAINSMYRWYKAAAVCYAYLCDVDDANGVIDAAGAGSAAISAAFRSSRWFTRGWTLQELLAPPGLVFFDTNWVRLGTRAQLSGLVQSATGIPTSYLLGWDEVTRDASVAQRMSWAASRETTRPEDGAYALLGLFGVSIPLLYGEGGPLAFQRLQIEIMRHFDDPSVLAWGYDPTHDEGTEAPAWAANATSPSRLHGGLFALSATDYRHCGDVVPCHTYSPPANISGATFDALGGGLRIPLAIHEDDSGVKYAMLNCRLVDDAGSLTLISIPLEDTDILVTGQKGADDYARPNHRSPRRFLYTTAHSVRMIHIRKNYNPVQQDPGAGLGRFYVLPSTDASSSSRLVEVWPKEAWNAEQCKVVVSESSPHCKKCAGMVYLRFRDHGNDTAGGRGQSRPPHAAAETATLNSTPPEDIAVIVRAFKDEGCFKLSAVTISAGLGLRDLAHQSSLDSRVFRTSLFVLKGLRTNRIYLTTSPSRQGPIHVLYTSRVEQHIPPEEVLHFAFYFVVFGVVFYYFFMVLMFVIENMHKAYEMLGMPSSQSNLQGVS